ncbi:MAG: hypothetical protein R2729_11160 [Bryobacteraceae bacterium]
MRTLLLFIAALPALAQFGGREGETVVYMVTSKGPHDIRLAGSASAPAGGVARVEVKDVASLPSIPLGEGFPEGFQRQIMHEEADDLFHLVTQSAPDTGFHRVFLASYKTFIIGGLVRETEFDNLDYTANSLTTLKKNVDFGPDQALETLKVLFWTRDPDFPAVQEVPSGVSGPAVPPGMVGDEVIFNIGVVPFFLPWKPMRRWARDSGWPDGVDSKLLEIDAEEGSGIQIVRLRKGASTPRMRIAGSTHLYVLQGRLILDVPGRGEFTMPANHYAFIPTDVPVILSNPRVPAIASEK